MHAHAYLYVYFKANNHHRNSKVSLIDVPSVETNVDNQSSFRDDEEDNFSIETIAKYTCFTGVFNDGLSLSFSNQRLKPRRWEIYFLIN